MIEETVKRINELAHKAKAEGLTPEEAEERDRLRKIYIAAVRQNLQAQLDNTYLVDENGESTRSKRKNRINAGRRQIFFLQLKNCLTNVFLHGIILFA